MKKRNKILALLMALVLIMTSVTVDYKKTKADGGSFTLTIAKELSDPSKSSCDYKSFAYVLDDGTVLKSGGPITNYQDLALNNEPCAIVEDSITSSVRLLLEKNDGTVWSTVVVPSRTINASDNVAGSVYGNETECGYIKATLTMASGYSYTSIACNATDVRVSASGETVTISKTFPDYFITAQTYEYTLTGITPSTPNGIEYSYNATFNSDTKDCFLDTFSAIKNTVFKYNFGSAVNSIDYGSGFNNITAGSDQTPPNAETTVGSVINVTGYGTEYVQYTLNPAYTITIDDSTTAKDCSGISSHSKSISKVKKIVFDLGDAYTEPQYKSDGDTEFTGNYASISGNKLEIDYGTYKEASSLGNYSIKVKKDGITYSVSGVTLDDSCFSTTGKDISATLSATNYKLNITKDTSVTRNATIEYCVKDDEGNYGTWNAWSADTLFENTKKYKLKIASNDDYKILTLENSSNVQLGSVTYSGTPWRETVEYEFNSNPGALTYKERKPKLTNIEATTTSFVPGFDQSVSYKIVLENDNNLPIPSGISVSPEFTTSYTEPLKTQVLGYWTSTGGTDPKVKFSPDGVEYYKENASSIGYKLKLNLTSEYIDTYLFVPMEKEITLNISDVTYGTDFKINTSNEDTLYYNAGLFYYNPAYSNGFTVYNTYYNEFRKKEKAVGASDYAAYSAFESIGESKNVTFGTTVEKMKFQMKNTNTDSLKFGVSDEITLVSDSFGPELVVNRKSGVGDNLVVADGTDKFVVTINRKTFGELFNYSASDLPAAPADNSGVRKIYIQRATEDPVVLTDAYAFGNDSQVEYKVFALDNVGNKSNEYTLIVTNDTNAPVISATVAGWKKATADMPADGTAYFNNAQDSIVIGLNAEDDNLAEYGTTTLISAATQEAFSVDILDGAGVSVFDASWVGGNEFSASENSYTETVTIPSGTLASGTYTVVAKTHDISTVDSPVSYSFTIVVDNDKADNIKVYAEEVNVADPTGIFADVKENYTGYNADSELKVSFTDDNYDVAQKVDVRLGIDDLTVAVNGSGTAYSGSTSFADIDEQFNVASTECIASITDKALNVAFSNIHKFEACDVKSDNIVIVKNPAALSDIKLAVENDRFLNLSDSKLTGSLKFTGATMFVPEFLRFTLDEVGGESVVLTTENSGFTFTTSGENISFSFNTSLLKSDTEYTVTAYYYDIAATKVQTAITPSCVYDTTAPVITAEVDKTTSTVKLTMVEKYPDFANFETSFSGYNNEGTIDGSKATYTADSKAAASFINLGAALKNEAAWKNEGNSTYTTVIKMNLEGTYTFSVGVKDFSPLTGKDVASATFIYDVTAPDMRDANNTPRIAVLATESSTNSDYSQFDKEKATVIFELYELASTDVTVTCKLSDVNTGDEEFNITSGSLKREGSNFSGAFDINKNFKGTIHFKTKDGNGNVTDYNVDYANGLIVEQPDMHAQTSTATITDMNPGYAVNGIYNEDVQLKFDVKDTYSGIRSIKYTLNGVEAYADLDKTGGIVTTWSKNATITANHQNEGKEILAVLDVVDNAGYTTQVLQSYNIDVTSPVITVAYDRNTPLNEKYYKETRTATITIREYNFDPQGVSLIVKRDETQLTVAPNFNTDGVVRYDENGKPYYTYVMNYPFADDGDYEFTLSCTDMAGNLTQYGQTDSFTIDKTKPVVTLTYDNNNVHNSSYYGEARTATITVEEHNFNANDIQVNVAASIEGATTTAPTVSAFATNGDRHTATVSFNKDADFTISVEGIDLAGNVADEIAEQKFTIDLEAPEIEITGVKDNSSYNGEVLPIVVVKDGNYDVNGVSLKVEGGKNGTTNPVYTTADSDHGQTFTFENIAKEQGNDDCYTLTATAVDKAGHSTEVVVNYRVNRFGSTYEINDKLEAAIEKYYATASDEFVITEVNVDKVSECNISYTVDTDIVNLESGTDYSVKESTNSNGWNQYDYTLSGDTFDKEGVYTISISSKDEVGNVSDNKSKGLSMEFCIDNTAPVCIISGVEEGQKIERDLSAEIVVEAYDNIMFDTMQVYVNGSVVKTEADMADGKVAFVIEPSAGDQTLKVVCKDAAGNEKIEEVHFTFDVGILKSNSWLKIVIPIAAILLVGGGAFFFIAGKKRKKNN